MTDADGGAAIAGASVTVDGTSLATTTGSNGSYTIEDVPQGSRNVTASASGYVAQTKSASIVGGETTTLDFALAAEAGDPDPPAPGDASLATISYSGNGGPNGAVWGGDTDDPGYCK